jgi:anti-anti-sigma factor
MASADPPLPQFSVQRSQQDGAQVITLIGELDLASSDELERVLEEARAAQPRHVCLDLAALEFIDSTGLATVLRGHQAISGDGGRLAVACPPGPVRQTLETTGLLEMLNVADDRSQALRTLG